MSGNPKAQDLVGRLVPKQQILNHPVTFGTSIHANRSLSRQAKNPSRIKALPPLEKNNTVQQPENRARVDTESLTSPFKFVEYAKANNLEDDFVYLLPQNMEEDADNPTRLRIVPSSQINKEDYWTLSLAGLSHYKNTQIDFIPLNDWLRSCELFKQIMTIPFFKHFHQWKSFTSWKRSVVRDAMISASSSLRDHLFLVHPILRPAFFNIQREIQKLHSIKLYNLRGDSLYSLDEFAAENKRHREQINKTLNGFLSRVTEMVQVACEKTIDTLSSLTATDGSTQDSPLDHLITQYEKAAHRGVSNAIDNGPLTFTQRAANRTLCAKLVKFIKLVDDNIISVLRSICFQSNIEFYCIMATLHKLGLKKLNSDQMQPLPELVLSSEFGRLYPGIEAKVQEFFESPVFRVDINLKDVLQWTPCEQHVTDIIDDVRKKACKTLYKLPRLIQNQAFRQYISPDGSSDHQQEKITGPDLTAIIESDKVFTDIIDHQNNIIKEAFKSLSTFSTCYQKAVEIYQENEKFDANAMIIESRISAQELGQMIDNYNKQIDYLATIEEKSEVGLFCQFAKEMKMMFSKSPVDCLNQIKNALPILTRKLLDEFSEKVHTAHDELLAPIEDVSSFVNYLSAADKYSANQNDFQERYESIKDFYTLADNLNVSINTDEQSEYQSLVPVFDDIKRALAITGEQKQTMMPKFSQQLDKHIAQLHSQVLDVAQLSLNPILANITTKISDAQTFLATLLEKLNQVKTAASDYNRYQRAMNLPVTRFEDVEELSKEVSLKNLLWSTKVKWNDLTEKWNSTPFSVINPTDMADELREFQMASAKCAKGLQGNVVAIDLKASVTDYTALLPVVSDLKNPALKQRFMEQIAQILGCNIFDDENFKFGRLFELHAFNYVEQISAISAQATNEQALHDMLTNVQKMVDKLQFIITPYPKQKNTYLFGGFDDILTQLDEAQSIVSTVRSSRYIAALRTRADEWARSLRAFSTTIDELMTCQRAWLYLANVFAVPDMIRQLSDEYKQFQEVDHTWRNLSAEAHDDPSAFRFCTATQTLPALENANKVLEAIQKRLEEYLENKRQEFPRFYFLSNDDLLDLLSKSREPEALQPHLRKMFEGLYRLEMNLEDNVPNVTAMISAEGETIPLRPTKLRSGGVETWMQNIEEQCERAMRAAMKTGRQKYQEAESREDWIGSQPAQVVLAVTQIDWCEQVEYALSSGNPEENLKALNEDTEANLANLARLVRLDLPDLERTKVSALITMDVHSRDIVTEMINKRVNNINDFEWFKRLKYRWDETNKEVIVQQTNTTFQYGYEYLGCTSRLVITPLTDRCYLTLTGALHLHLGGSPAGPAGTGKTETVKDLAKALAIFCVVFNCSDSVTVFQMSSFFRGLAQAGAWACFDEFNRINIEVLSVIAEQFNSIRLALIAEVKRFDFEGKDIPINPRCGCFITMNPGYAGRTELPDNLKALFRPVSMMIPDYTLIAEIMLYSQGFQEAKPLSSKMTKLYKLSSEMLSQQDHYDFGMRALKSVLVMAGSLKRSDPEASEDQTLIRAMRDSNLAKFLNEDIPLFNGIVADLFPGVEIVDKKEEYLTNAATSVTKEMGLQPTDFIIEKVVQLHDAMRFRHGVMLVGPTCGGKTTTKTILEKTNTLLSQTMDDYRPVVTYTLNPKALTMAELYGEQNLDTQEWVDGLIAIIFNECVDKTDGTEQWIIFDGPVDALWIENMNTVLDDNKLLSLANSQRIKMTPVMHLLFEVNDLAVASPATVSRCAMVYVDPEGLGWRPFCETAINQRISPLLGNNIVLVKKFKDLLEVGVDPVFQFLRENCKHGNRWIPMNLIFSLFNLFEAIIKASVDAGEITFSAAEPDGDIIKVVTNVFVFAFVWSFGGHADASVRLNFDTTVRDIYVPLTNLPARNTLYDWNYVIKSREWVHWQDLMPPFELLQKQEKKDDDEDEGEEEKKKEIKFHSLLVPTVDTTRFSYLLKTLITSEHDIFLRGSSGTGKSVIIQRVLKELDETGQYHLIPLIFSAHTASFATQEMLESKLEKKRGSAIQPPNGKHGLLFIDDINMPELDTYGSQPPIELLRSLLSMGGLYERPGLHFNEIKNLILIGAGGPDGGGRAPMTTRFIRFLFNLELTPSDDNTLYNIFHSILMPSFADFSEPVKNSISKVTLASVDAYTTVAQTFLPTPDKSHYMFNLRDLANVVQGIMRAKPEYLTTQQQLEKLWLHENMRVYSDRLICEEDRKELQDILQNTMKKKLGTDMTATDEMFQGPLLFSDYMRGFVPDSEKAYEEITDYAKARKQLDDYLEEYSFSKRQQSDPILFFDAAIQHITRICRILRQPRGHVVLVGVAGTGKRTLARFASFVSECELAEIEVTDHYQVNDFREDLKNFYLKAGVGGKRLAFIISDTQLVNDNFLELINNVLNTGEIPNLFSQEETDKFCNDIVSYAKSIGANESRDNLIKLFFERVRENLHIVLTMSPVGNSFRHRCRMFPSLVSCCTIDWVDTWPESALQLVAHTRFSDIILNEHPIEGFPEKLSNLAVYIHQQVSSLTNRMKTEMGRIYYVTPALFIRFVSFYEQLLSERQSRHNMSKNRLEGGVEKLVQANELVDHMKEQLSNLEPILAKAAKDTDEMLVKIKADQEEADRVKETVSAEEKVVQKQASEAETMAAEAQKDLDAVTPMLEEATAQLKGLSRSDVAEVRQYSDPHICVRTVMEAVCILSEVEPTWKSAVSLVSDPMFISKISSKYGPTKHVPLPILKKIQPYVEENTNFQPDEVGRVSVAAQRLCIWATFLYKFEMTYREVEPKQIAVAEAKAALKAAREALAEKQAELQRIMKSLQELKDKYDASVAEKTRLADQIAETQVKLERAGKLTVGLADEKVRWAEQVEEMNKNVIYIPGDSFLCAAILIYLGPFPSAYRSSLIDDIIAKINETGIELSPNFDFMKSMTDESVVRDWQTMGLGNDQTSIENSLIITMAPKSALIIDPQNQATQWIKNMEQNNQLTVLKPNSPNFYRSIENAVRLGIPVLLEDVSNTVDPALDSLLMKKYYKQDGKLMVRIGDKAVEIDDKFRIYVTTKLTNPHFMPDMFVKVSIVNFIVTQPALEAQQLSLVVSLERPELEKQKYDLVMSIAADKKVLVEIEDKLLELLRNAGQHILDDEVLITTIEEAKKKSIEVKARVKESEEAEIQINELRLAYKPVAVRASIMFFVTGDMANIDPMYQYSLEFFRDLVNSCITTAPESEDRMATLINRITYSTYVTVSRGLFEVHRSLFAFSMCSAIMRNSQELNAEEWEIFIRGPPLIDNPQENPLPALIADSRWNELYALGRVIPNFAPIVNRILGNLELFSEFLTSDSIEVPKEFSQGLEEFQLLIFFRTLAIDRLSRVIQQFVANHMGVEFTRSPMFDLRQSFKDTRPTTPLLFILSQGADPRAHLLKIAQEMQMENRLKMKSLGQGQGPEAEKAIQGALTRGEWVYLQNCHLSLSWLPELENIVSKFSPETTHPDFRLFLSSMPTSGFPVSILRNSVKVTNEPPKGIRAHLIRLLGSISPDEYEGCTKPKPWKKLLFGLSFFHAVIQERKKFGPLGFNKIYEWTETDFTVSVSYLRMFLDEQPTVPWDALHFLTGEIIYGGRVTDDWDRTCMMSILSRYYNPEILNDGYFFARGSTYYAPPAEDYQKMMSYVNSLPFDDDYDVFGMHANAEITSRRRVSEQLLNTLQTAGGVGNIAGSGNDFVLQLVHDLQERMPKINEISTMHESLKQPINDNADPLTVVLKQETERFRKLIKIITESLQELEKALRGLVTMSPQLENVLQSLYVNRVPDMWAKYESMKPLGSWFSDLIKRVDFFNQWMREGHPNTFWISAFYFPQSFLTGILQRHSRIHQIPIDNLSFESEVLTEEPTKFPEIGVVIRGLYFDGARWNKDGFVDEQDPGQIYSEAPYIHLIPTNNNQQQTSSYYQCPIYITAKREGVLSTTGTSTNFVVAIPLSTKASPDHWIQRGTALLLGTPE